MKNIDHATDNLASTSYKVMKANSHPFWRWFWLTFLFVSLAYAFHSFYVPSNDIAWVDNLDLAQELATDSDKKIMLFFTGAWCVPCRIMKREVFADNEVMNVMSTEIISVMIDIDDPDAQELVSQYNAGATPLTVFTNHQGEVLDYALGKIGKKKFLEMLENLNSKAF